MKVLILTTIMAPYRINLFNELGKYCELTVCFEQKNENSRNSNWFSNIIHNFQPIMLKHWDKGINRIKYDIFNQFKKTKYDLAIAYEYSTLTSILFIIMCKINKIPYLINSDGNFINSHLIKDIVKRFLISGAAGCLASGKYAKEYFLFYGAREEDIYFHNFTSLYADDILSEPIDPEKKIRLRNRLQLSRYSKIVITVGRFIRSKRIDVLISAWEHLPSDWLLVIVGEGELEHDYKRQVEDASLANVIFTGHLKAEKLKEYYLASDLFVLPTELDVWGLVVNEALSSGLPVITTDKCIAGLELITDGHNGYISSVGDVESLSTKIKDILLDEKKYPLFSTNALNSIKNYTYESVSSSHMYAIKKILH